MNDKLLYARIERKMDLIIKALMLICEASLKSEETYAFDITSGNRERILRQLHDFLEKN